MIVRAKGEVTWPEPAHPPRTPARSPTTHPSPLTHHAPTRWVDVAADEAVMSPHDEALMSSIANIPMAF